MKAPEPPLLQVKSDCFCIYVLTGIFLKLVISISLIQPARAKKFDDEEIFWCQHPCLSEYPNSDCIRFAVITVQSFFFFFCSKFDKPGGIILKDIYGQLL